MRNGENYMDWSRGFSSRFIMNIVDPSTWADREEYEFISGSIAIDNSSSLIQSGEFKMSEKISDGENYIRIYLLANQNGNTEKVAIYTGLTATPERSLSGYVNRYSVNTYSVLKPAKDVILKRGYYAPKGSGAYEIKKLLSVCAAPIVVEDNSPIIKTDIVSNDGDTRLDLALSILSAINWRIKIDGSGTIYICSQPSNVAVSFGIGENDCIETSVTDKYDWYDCPNVFMAISEEDGASVARDDDIDSILSTVNRGREVWMCERNVTLSNMENIVEYARRRLKEEQSPVRTVSYRRRFFEDLYATDIIRLNYPGHGLMGLYQIKKQNISIEYGCTVDEEVVSIE